MNNCLVRWLDISMGEGSFGSVFLALRESDYKLLAVKREDKTTEHHLLKREYAIINTLNRKGHDSGIIKAFDYWEDSKFCYMSTELYGPSICSLHRKCGKTFSVETSIRLAIQIMDSITFCHTNGVVHRDVKPSNFLIDYTFPHNRVYLADFGLSKKYMVNGKHLPYNEKTIRAGSLRYMSPYTHKGVEVSCRDDLYGFIYTLIGFTCNLPWSDVIINRIKSKDDKHWSIYEYKKSIRATELCKDVTCRENCDCYRTCMIDLLSYISKLSFAEHIDYIYMRDMLTKVYQNHVSDQTWDWNKFYPPETPL
jgi:serine/threonine protein kinase